MPRMSKLALLERELLKPFKAERDALLKADIDIPAPEFRKKMNPSTVDCYIDYYEKVLEGLGGEQIWQILDAYEHLCEIKRESRQL